MAANMFKRLAVSAAALGALGVASCESDGGFGSEWSPSQRNAAIGAGVGAVAGAAVAGNNAQGAILGGVLGGAVGYYTGCRQQGGCFVGGRKVEGERRYDSRAERYYFTDEQTGRTYWENGDQRS